MVENLSKAVGEIRIRVWAISLFIQLGVVLICWLLFKNTEFGIFVFMLFFIFLSILGSLVVGWLSGHYASIPLKAFGNAIIHVSPSQNAPAPKTDDLKVGREYVSSLVYQLYQVASLQDNKILAEHKREATQSSNILTHLPLPVLVFNKQQLITFGTDTALDYCGLSSGELFGKQLFEVMDLEFPSEFTLDSWIKDCQANKATDTAYWHHVRMKLKTNDSVRQFDMAGYYNRDNPTGIDFILTMFDRTDEYKEQDDSLSFLALAVHELRTPLTLMKGYIEVFEDDLKAQLDPEMARYLEQLRGASEQLTTFVNNILNVTRIEENQFTVKLAEEKWNEIIEHVASDMSMRAKALDVTLNFHVADNLPTVAVDRATIYEVLCNLIDNAIKYSGDSKVVEISSQLTKDGLIETLVNDMGLGIPTNVIPSLFEKFHRNHRNSARIGGTGLGLYISKVIVNAHGGDIWVKSKINSGTTVGFTVKSFSSMASELKSGDTNDMVRTAHGWIKNHSLYRR